MSATEKTSHPHSVSVVVPVFNSTLTLPELVRRLEVVLSDGYGSYELVLVNDGSSDESWQTICGLREERDWIRGINLMRNYGQHSALLAGIRAAGGDVIVTLDDDLQHPPEEIPKLLAELSAGCDVVYGMPREDRHAVWRNACSRVGKRIILRLSGKRTTHDISAFRAFHATVRGAFDHLQGPFVSIDAMLAWGASRYASVPVQHAPRAAGTSQYTLAKLVAHALNMMTGFAVWPLRLVAVMGGLLALFGVAVLVFVLVQYFVVGQSVPGFTFLASMIAIFGGGQMIALGLVGEYLARVYSGTIGRPPYVIKEDTAGGETRDRSARV